MRWSQAATSPPRALARSEGRRNRRERGTTLVEVAFAIPIMITLILTFVDLGLGDLQTSQATSAAADGARVGILAYPGADVSGSTNHLAIEAAIRKRLAGQPVNTIAVSCVTPEGATVTCAASDPDVDKLKVTVSWKYSPISPLGKLWPTQNVSGSATMALVRQPVDPVTEAG